MMSKLFNTATDFMVRTTQKSHAYGLSLCFLQSVRDDRMDSLWYGGPIVSFTYRGYEFLLSANGDVIATLFKDQVEVARCKDKGNNGGFADHMYPYIINDDQLNHVPVIESPEDPSGLLFDNNNWFEWSITNRETGESLDILPVPVYHKMNEALDYMKEMLVILDRHLN